MKNNFFKNINILAWVGCMTLLTFFTLNAGAAAQNNNFSKKYLSSQNWWQDELAVKRKILAAFWQDRILNYKQKSVDDFRDLIIGLHFPSDPLWNKNITQLFQDAVSKRLDFETFFTALQNVPLNLFQGMNNWEKLVPEDQYEDINPVISNSDLLNLQQYFKDKHISASVTLGSGKSELITPDFPANQSQSAFAIHSVGKVFTGVLALIMIREGVWSEGDLQRPVKLDDSVLKQLPLPVRERLKTATLYQLMTHRSGLGDYLQKYMEAISQGNVPNIRQAEDFVPFVEAQIYPVGEERYSNAGLLIVGLAIKHAYENKFKTTISYDDILQKYIIQKAGMTTFSPWKPVNGKYNPDDKVAPYLVGSPAGGYWTTSADLAKFGKWIYTKSTLDHEFKNLIEKYGQEFYQSDKQTIAHSGGIPSSTAYLAVSLKSGAVAAILSDQPGMAVDLNKMIQTHLFSRKIELNNENQSHELSRFVGIRLK